MELDKQTETAEETAKEATSTEVLALREQWESKVEFILSCLGFCVGLGNVWRFPYLAFENGGGAFLIPYFIMLFLCGIPLFQMELCIGQFAGVASIAIWNSAPVLKGVGYGMVIVSFFTIIYYNIVIAWSLFYLFASFNSKLPWTRCDQWWNKLSACSNNIANATSANSTNSSRPTSTAEEYFKYRVLRIDKSLGVDDPGKILWDLCLCSLLSWIIVNLSLMKGIKSSGKVVYFTATFPYVILTVLLVRGCSLEGAGDGIFFYLNPKWEKLGDSTVWTAAATQIFYSLGVSFGSLVTFASYNKFDNTITRDTFVVAIGNCATSIFAGFAIFSVIGHMAFRLGLKVEQVIDQGPGLAFIAYPEAVALLPLPHMWSVLFFFMLVTLGMDSQFAYLETVVAGCIDQFPRQLQSKRLLVTISISIVAFLLSILLVTEGGMYWFQLYNHYSAFYGLLALALCMCIGVSMGYGFFFTHRWRFNLDIKLMLGNEPHWYFKINWMFITPALLLFLLIYAGLNASRITYAGYIYPKWADDLGICMSLTVFAGVPIYAIVHTGLAHWAGKPLKSVFLPNRKWGPSDKSIPYHHLEGVSKVSATNLVSGDVASANVDEENADMTSVDVENADMTSVDMENADVTSVDKE